MPTTTEAGLSTDKLIEISHLVKRAGEEAVQLRIVERFLSEVERRLLKATPQVFDIERIRTALQILKTLTDEDDIDECLEAEFRLDQEFHLWRELIITRDQKIETYHFRRLCDSSPYPLEDEIFVALASFYRSLDFTPAGQSKFDLSVTRLFTRAAARGRREMRSLRSDNVKRLRQLFGARVLVDSGAIVSPDAIENAVSTIDSFIDEALSLTDFEDLVRSNIFDRYRAFKRDLGSTFFEPEIVAAAIECNVVVGNAFNDLIASADEKLSSSLTADVDLAGALHDAAPESRSHVNELFRVFFGENDNHEAVSGDVDYLGKLLEISSPQSKSTGSQNGVTSAQGRIAPVLRMLSEARPDNNLLSKQMQRSEIFKGVDPHDFLFSADGAPDVLCRRAFGVILWSIEFREQELRSGEIGESTRHEARSLLSKAEALATKLQHEIEVSDELNESRLRAVLNALLDARLKLERAIVRFSSSKIETAPVPEKTPDEHRQAISRSPKSNDRLSLLWKTLALLAVVLAGFYLYSQGFFKELVSLLDRG